MPASSLLALEGLKTTPTSGHFYSVTPKYSVLPYTVIPIGIGGQIVICGESVIM